MFVAVRELSDATASWFQPYCDLWYNFHEFHLEGSLIFNSLSLPPTVKLNSLAFNFFTTLQAW